MRLLEGSLDDTDQLAETLQSFDVVISFLQGMGAAAQLCSGTWHLITVYKLGQMKCT